MPIMANVAATITQQMALLMRFMVLEGIPRIRLRDVFNEERCALDGAVAFEKVELVVGDSLEKRGRAGWDGAGSKFIGNRAKNFVHRSILVVTIKPLAFFASFGIAAPLLCLLKGQASFDGAVGFVDVGVIKADDFVGGHGSACSELLSNEELDSLHVFINFALGWSAGGKIAACKAVHVLGLSF
jgi:hypothetical protein